MKKILFTSLTLLFAGSILAQNIEQFDVNDKWLAKIEALAPSTTRVQADTKKIMVFSQHTGFYHWTIPHNAEMLKILGEKTGAFEVTIAYDVDSFSKKNLKKYDAVILNNSNPGRPQKGPLLGLIAKELQPQ